MQPSSRSSQYPSAQLAAGCHRPAFELKFHNSERMHGYNFHDTDKLLNPHYRQEEALG